MALYEYYATRQLTCIVYGQWIRNSFYEITKVQEFLIALITNSLVREPNGSTQQILKLANGHNHELLTEHIF
jgi:hypothetical protein